MKRIAIEMDEVIIDLNHKLTAPLALQPVAQPPRAALFEEIEDIIGEETFTPG